MHCYIILNEEGSQLWIFGLRQISCEIESPVGSMRIGSETWNGCCRFSGNRYITSAKDAWSSGVGMLDPTKLHGIVLRL